MSLVSRRGQDISPFLAMEVMEEAEKLRRQGADIVHFEVGEPDFDTPACVKEAAAKALRDGHTHYTHSMGLLELREAICEDSWRRYRVVVTPDRVLVTGGTSPALFMVYAALLRPGDEVVLANPYYACYPNYIRFADGEPVYVPVCEDDGYQLRPEAIQARLSPRTRAIMVNSPANPTGVVLDAARLAAIANLGHFVVSDEIYHGLVYEGTAHSILEYTDHACVLNGFSKLYAMTGWRLGYVIAPPELIRALQKMHQNFFISANAFVQWAGVAALREAQDDVARMCAEYDRRRQAMLEGLRALGLGVARPPTGAFYVLANARHLSGDSLHLAFDILQRAKVAVTPGIDFGSNAEGYLRFSYTTKVENIAEGVARLSRYLVERAG